MARKSSVERANEIIGGFATAQKNVVIQFGDKERRTNDLLNCIKEDLLSKGVADSDIEKVDVYVKPEEHKVFYVVNEKINGSVEF
ncbi:DUF6465 family protein [Butyrivibrio sp. VCD2006]|uniref:DUF6465 family protein n=1 Tax=Butyrivibrio sp. VCD2006 TaxID=1280664 RepID=UPI00040EA8BC|nr:DUF6465 family protein [Butyrivibrio sp. VCD2006]